MQFYISLFCTTMDNRSPVLKTVIDRGPRLTEDHRLALTCSFSVDDIKRVLDHIPSSKAPGVDGFNSHFFKNSWDTIKDDVYEAIYDYFTYGKIPKEVNVTYITLVPRVNVPAYVSDFRPISC